jgi:nucleoside-diphosphate-sugar epimerase
MTNRVVTVFGGGGYVGSRLVPQLISEGYSVRVFDTFWYGKHFFKPDGNLQLITADIRDLDSVKRSLVGTTDVIHLACISNDPSFDLDPKLGKSINLDSFDPLVKAAKQSGVRRFIYASSSSVYGVKEEERVTEDLSLEPLTDYSKFKSQCEEILLNQISENFETIVVRPATICGYGPRQRFDLAVNILTNHAINKGSITVFGGEQFRPNLHIDDMVAAYAHLLNVDSRISGDILNIGGKNMSLDEIAELVVRTIGEHVEVRHESTNDLRSYRVDSSRIEEKYGFFPQKTVEDAIKDLAEKFRSKSFEQPMTNSVYFNIARMKELALG